MTHIGLLDRWLDDGAANEINGLGARLWPALPIGKDMGMRRRCFGA
jgi:hypothetical protein